MMKAISLCFYFLLLCSSALAQTLLADFSLPSTACLEENIVITNTSVNANRYEWDVCQGDLSLTPAGSITGVVSGSSIPTGLDIVFDGLNWYGFITSRDNNSIIRVSFGADLEEVGSTFNLGNVSSLLDRPTDIKVVSSEGNWYAFVYNEGANLILRLDFGTSLTNAPSAIVIDNSATGTGNQGLDLIQDGTTWYIAYTLNSKVGVIRLNDIESIPLPADKILTTDLTETPALGDIKLLSNEGSFYAYTVSYTSNKLYRLSFGSNLISMPNESDISSGLSSAFNYYAIDGGYDAGKFFLFVGALPGNIFRVNLGPDLDQNPLGIDTIGDLGVFSNVVKNRLIKSGTTWYYFSINFSSGNIYKAVFPTPTCQAAPGFYTTQDLNLSFNLAGTKHVALRSFNDGAFDDQYKSVSISSLTAPIIDFTNQQNCFLSPISFIFSSDQTILSQNWDFGDGQSSPQPNPQNTYSSIGEYQVSLTVNSSNTCNNYLEKEISIYGPLTPDFDLPSASPICTNQDYLFTNTTSFDSGSNPTWQWEVNGTPTSTVEDLTYQIPTATMQDIKLIATIPGCSSEVTKTINTVEDGPLTDFSFSNDCEDKSITFTNSTVGTVIGYSWDFGDGNNSTQTNATNTFTDFGKYDVTLEATNAAGCVNTSVQEITIYSKPQPNFSLALPPFSCSGTSSQFTDLTPNPTDSNLSGWTWSFGDPLNGTSNVRNAVYTYTTAAQYDVNLEVTTNFGCTASTQKTITISQSPNAAFTSNAACVNQATVFTPLSTTGVNSWQWKIGTSTYSQQSPTHVFGSASNYNAMLTATGTNGCIAVTSKTISVPIPSNVNFSSSNNCADQNTSFTDLTPPGTDAVISRSWQFGTIGAGSGATPSFVFPSSGSYPTKLTVTNASGCSYSFSKNVTIVDSPVATFSATPQIGTPPLTVQLTNTSQGSVSQLWLASDANNSTSTAAAPVFVFNDLGEFVVDLTIVNAQGCSDTASKIISVITPSLDIELTNVTLLPAITGETNILITLANKGNFPVTNIKAVVDISGQSMISETINAVIQPFEVYTQVLAASIIESNIQSNYTCVELVVDGDKDNSNNKKCVTETSSVIVKKPYPNPGSKELNLEWIASTSNNAEIYLFDPTGRKVFENAFSDLNVGLNRVTISLASLNPGLYYVFFVSEGVRKSFPFVVNK